MTGMDRPTRRVFIAVLPDAVTRNALAREVAAIDNVGHQGLRWLAPEDWHITLRFIGAVGIDRLDALKACTQAVAARHGPLSLRLTHIEAFPAAEHPRVLAATGPAAPASQALVEELESACRTPGLRAATRTWRCHLTLARIRGRPTVSMDPRAIDLSMAAQHLVLMAAAVAGQQRRRYRTLESWPLGS